MSRYILDFPWNQENIEVQKKFVEKICLEKKSKNAAEMRKTFINGLE